MILQPPSSRVLGVGTFVVFLFIVFLYLPSKGDYHLSSQSGEDGERQHSLSIDSFGWRSKNAPPPKPANSTLDFQEILYISMPHRTDRQDALSLMAAQTGLKLTFNPGVKGNDMVETSWPLTAPPEDPKNLAWLGIWRAHANAWRYIIDNNLGSALIIEDDVDWDVNLKDIMGRFNWQLRYNNSMRANPSKDDKYDECEYGCDWDQLFVGHCKNEPHPTDLTHQSYHDPDSPAISTAYPIFVEEMTKKWNYSAQDTDVRVISPTYDPLCTMGYAISNKGARRALYQMGGFKPIKMAVDLEFIHHNREGRLNSYTMSPPPFVKWETKGKGNSDNSYRRRRSTTERRRSLHEKAEDLGSSTAGGSSKGLKQSVRKSLSVLDGVVHEWQ